jgi:NADPH:quinone reductase-like Zn-dependent oxidoreductase
MKAVVQERYGPSDVLSLRDIPAPVPGGRRRRSRGLDLHDREAVRGAGRVRPVEAARPGARALAGVVAAVGSGVTRLAVGDPVYGSTPKVSYAEYAVAPERLLAAMPAGLAYGQAAAVPISGQTALRAVRGWVTPRARVMVIGAAGGGGLLGGFTRQLRAPA